MIKYNNLYEYIPQISPIDWLILSLYFLIIYFLGLVMLYYILRNKIGNEINYYNDIYLIYNLIWY